MRTTTTVPAAALSLLLLAVGCSGAPEEQGTAEPSSASSQAPTAGASPTTQAPGPTQAPPAPAGGDGRLPAEQLDQATVDALLVPADAAPEGYTANAAVAAAAQAAQDGGQAALQLDDAEVTPSACREVLDNVPGTDPAAEAVAAFESGGAAQGAPRALAVQVVQSYAQDLPAQYTALLAERPAACDQVSVTLGGRGVDITVEDLQVPDLGEVSVGQRTTSTVGGQSQVSQNVVVASGRNVLLLSFSGAEVPDAERDALVAAVQDRLGG